MDAIRKIESVSDANALVGKETLHPLVTVIDFSQYGEMEYLKMNLNLFGVFLKTSNEVGVQYGRHHYDYSEGTMIFVAPGQVIGLGEGKQGMRFKPSGWGLMFHADLIRATSLAGRMNDYSFFSYDVREALHVSEQERQIVIDCFCKIDMELKRGVDRHTKMLVTSNIELLLNYCIRFYDRQFITRDRENHDTLAKFENVLNRYFEDGMARAEGLPSVAYCADQLNLSAGYFGDLIKKETGKTAQEHIQSKVIDVAKERIFDLSKSVTEIAYELGFKYPQHFSRLFKQRVGQSPNEYRNMN